MIRGVLFFVLVGVVAVIFAGDVLLCEDDKNTNCARHADDCANPDQFDLLKELCPKTCGHCRVALTQNLAADVCKDNGSNCPSWVKNGFCKNDAWTCEQRKYYCGKSCFLCLPGACGDCSDFSPSCETWNNVQHHFCTQPFYNCTIRKQYCAKTCKLCDTTC